MRIYFIKRFSVIVMLLSASFYLYADLTGLRIGDEGDISVDWQRGETLIVKGRHLIDPTGEIFIPRGPEVVITGGSYGAAIIDDIAETGANAVRLLLVLDVVNNQTPEKFDILLAEIKEKGLVAWLSLYTWDEGADYEIAEALGGGYLSSMEDYIPIWERDWLFNLVEKYKDHVIVDAMQEYKSSGSIQASTEEGRDAWKNASIKNILALRARGYTVPLEIMSNFQGRDLYAIIDNSDEILSSDTHVVDGQAQIIFGWQAYWDTASDYYITWQGDLLRGESTVATEAVELFVYTVDYPIMVGLLDGFDCIGGEMINLTMPKCAELNVGWLWWDWGSLTTEGSSPGPGSAVTTSSDGFPGAVLGKFNN